MDMDLSFGEVFKTKTHEKTLDSSKVLLSVFIGQATYQGCSQI